MKPAAMRIVDPEKAVAQAAVLMDHYPSVGSHDSRRVWGARLAAREARNADPSLDPDRGPNPRKYGPAEYERDSVCLGCEPR